MIGALLAAGCGGEALHPPCTGEARAKIGADYLLAIAEQCPHDHPLDDCPALPGIQAKYEAARKEWVACSER